MPADEFELLCWGIGKGLWTVFMKIFSQCKPLSDRKYFVLGFAVLIISFLMLIFL
jgi:hypothetical protein